MAHRGTASAQNAPWPAYPDVLPPDDADTDELIAPNFTAPGACGSVGRLDHRLARNADGGGGLLGRLHDCCRRPLAKNKGGILMGPRPWLRTANRLPLDLVDMVQIDRAVLGCDGGMVVVANLDRAVGATIGYLLSVDFQRPAATGCRCRRAVAEVDLDHIGPVASAAIDSGVAGNVAKHEQVVAGIAVERVAAAVAVDGVVAAVAVDDVVAGGAFEDIGLVAAVQRQSFGHEPGRILRLLALLGGGVDVCIGGGLLGRRRSTTRGLAGRARVLPVERRLIDGDDVVTAEGLARRRQIVG